MSLPVFARELLGEPEIVMLFRPVASDVAGARDVERPLQPGRADVDVAEDQRDEQNGHDGVHYLCELHAGDVDPGEEGEQQQKARHRDGNAGSKGKPIDKLLAQVKASGGRMVVLNEAAALLDPVDVNLLQKIVPEKNHPNQEETRDECEAGEVVHVFRHLGDIRESVWTNERQKHDFSKGEVQAGQAEN